jgi:Prophage protein (DUF1660)
MRMWWRKLVCRLVGHKEGPQRGRDFIVCERCNHITRIVINNPGPFDPHVTLPPVE